MNYWQVSAGSYQRDYTADFLKYGMAFVGGTKQIDTMPQVNLGDRMILKRGKTNIVAAGTVVERKGRVRGNAEISGEEDKRWLLDYDGWYLPAYCYVEWHVPPQPLAVKRLTRSTIQRCKILGLRQEADQIIATWPVRSLAPEPTSVADLSDDAILEFLVSKGRCPSTVELTESLKRIRLLAKHYYHEQGFRWNDVREHETRTFLIIPFLLALGWSEKQIKIELPVTGGRVDIACFSRVYHRCNDECVLVLESKGFSQGLDYAHGQGKHYATKFPKCQVVIASNGYCYKAYCRKPDGTGFEESPSAYLNLIHPTKMYPLDPSIGGGTHLLSYLLPPAVKLQAIWQM
ncbi:MAG: hypothetical protein NTX59_08610 [Elusimicrobia bacterium]|nr:hypothetical protein [Elusimicrobiota bacterium]